MRAKQQLGQNFLMHQKTADRVAASAGLPVGVHVLEIGPGTGMLTRALLKEGVRVTAIETDAELIPLLEETFAKEVAAGRLTIIHGDVRSFDLHTLPGPYFCVSNIPYYITGEILRLLLSAKKKPESITFLVQKEVAIRIARSEKESLLSLSVKIYGQPKYLFTVPRGAFRPAPKVDSAVLHIASIRTPFKTLAEEEFFFKLIHAGFGHKRKKLLKNLEIVATPEQLSGVFEGCSLSKDVRAEVLSLKDWVALATQLQKS